MHLSSVGMARMPSNSSASRGHTAMQAAHPKHRSSSTTMTCPGLLAMGLRAPAPSEHYRYRVSPSCMFKEMIASVGLPLEYTSIYLLSGTPRYSWVGGWRFHRNTTSGYTSLQSQAQGWIQPPTALCRSISEETRSRAQPPYFHSRYQLEILGEEKPISGDFSIPI